MTKLAFVSAVLIATSLFTSQAMASRNHVAMRRAMAAPAASHDCVRAPNVGSYASDPYPVPPCIPGTGN